MANLLFWKGCRSLYLTEGNWENQTKFQQINSILKTICHMRDRWTKKKKEEKHSNTSLFLSVKNQYVITGLLELQRNTKQLRLPINGAQRPEKGLYHGGIKLGDKSQRAMEVYIISAYWEQLSTTKRRLQVVNILVIVSWPARGNGIRWVFMWLNTHTALPFDCWHATSGSSWCACGGVRVKL